MIGQGKGGDLGNAFMSNVAARPAGGPSNVQFQSPPAALDMAHIIGSLAPPRQQTPATATPTQAPPPPLEEQLPPLDRGSDMMWYTPHQMRSDYVGYNDPIRDVKFPTPAPATPPAPPPMSAFQILARKMNPGGSYGTQ